MAEATILICDRCRRETPAVATLDVCARHSKSYHRHRAHDAERKARDRERHRKKRVNEKVEIAQPKRAGNGQAPWAGREAGLLALLPAVGSIGTQELERRMMSKHLMSRNVYGLVLARLKKKGLIAQKGVRGIGVSYARATPEAASG
jgi:hypothetical protein